MNYIVKSFDHLISLISIDVEEFSVYTEQGSQVIDLDTITFKDLKELIESSSLYY